MIKAAHFLTGDNEGILILVMVNKKNVTDAAIDRHLKKYLSWVSNKTNLKDIYVITTANYYMNGKVPRLLSKSFLKLAHKV